MDTELKVSFYGGVGKVTGANFLLSSKKTKVLVDCGLTQGNKEDQELNPKSFSYNPSEIDFLFITHAHIDHIGRIGKLVKDGFKGTIYSIDATKDLAVFMLADALKVMSYDGKEPLYGAGDVEKALSLWKTFSYHENITAGEFSVFAKDAGHILGSAIYEFTHTGSGKKIAFTGDLGNTPSPLIRDTENVSDIDYLVMESVYGDRNHENREQRKDSLRDVIKKVVARGGVLIVPVFSLEKTQALLYELDNFVESSEIPSVPVFLDSPLGIKLTSVYGNYGKYFNAGVQKEIKSGDEIFNFPKLEMTLSMDDSNDIRKTNPPMIIISSSGMSEGGRVNMHEKNFLSDKRNAILFIGYQVSGSLGRMIKEGSKSITIDKKRVKVNAEVISIDSYSSHKDSDGLLDFVANSGEKLKKVFVVMGEPKSSFFLAQKIKDNLDVEAVVPEIEKEYLL